MMWPLFNELTRLHTLAYRLSGGLCGSRVPGAPPMLLLDHVGARSGRQRTSPLAYLEDGDRIVIVASKGGSPHHPAWSTTCARTPIRPCRSVRGGSP
jgi:F420H(2)-dependent quinone reductase